MSCQKGGFISIRHDEIRDITCSLLKEVCSDVTKEPLLQPLQGEDFNYKTANVEQEARVDISARGFWNRGQKSFFDLQVFNPLALCYSGLSLDAAHPKNERDKIRKYSGRIINVEQGTFTPLVFTSAGGMARQSQIFYKRMAELMAEKKGEKKSFMAWLRCKVSFSLVKSALLCLRDTRSSRTHRDDLGNTDFENVVMKSRLDVDLK